VSAAAYERREEDGTVALLGSRCSACDAVRFPAADSCLRCGGVDVVVVRLPPSGVLWTFTVQGFRPKSPPYAGTEPTAEFVPYGVGYVDLGEVIVESRLTESDPTRLRIGMPMELVVDTVGSSGQETYAFRPVLA
jgi:uncharacterized OB-fold protein